MQLDIEGVDALAAFAQLLIAEHPALSVLISNAGIMRIEALDRSRDVADAEATITTNLLGRTRLTSEPGGAGKSIS